MKWQSGRRSKNVIDRRGSGGRRSVVGGGIGTIVIILVALYFGVDPTFLLEGMESASVSSTSSGTRPSGGDLADDPVADMISVVVADTEEVWRGLLPRTGDNMKSLVLCCSMA